MHACQEQGPGLRGSNLWRASQTLRPAAGEPRRPVHQRGGSCEPRRTTPSSGLRCVFHGLWCDCPASESMQGRRRMYFPVLFCLSGKQLCEAPPWSTSWPGQQWGLPAKRAGRPAESSASCRRMRGSAPGDGCRAGAALCPGAAVAWLCHCQQAGAGLAVAQPMCTALPAWPPSPWPAPAAVLPVTLAVPWPHKFECGDAVNAERALAPPLVMFPGMSLFSFFI